MSRGPRGLFIAGVLLICSLLSADEPPAPPPPLIVAPHGAVAELRIVEVGGNKSRCSRRHRPADFSELACHRRADRLLERCQRALPDLRPRPLRRHPSQPDEYDLKRIRRLH